MGGDLDISLLHRMVQHLLTILLVLLISCPQSVEADPHSLETLVKQSDQIELNPSSAGRKRKMAESQKIIKKQILIIYECACLNQGSTSPDQTYYHDTAINFSPYAP